MKLTYFNIDMKLLESKFVRHWVVIVAFSYCVKLIITEDNTYSIEYNMLLPVSGHVHSHFEENPAQQPEHPKQHNRSITAPLYIYIYMYIYIYRERDDIHAIGRSNRTQTLDHAPVLHVPMCALNCLLNVEIVINYKESYHSQNLAWSKSGGSMLCWS